MAFKIILTSSFPGHYATGQRSHGILKGAREVYETISDEYVDFVVSVARLNTSGGMGKVVKPTWEKGSYERGLDTFMYQLREAFTRAS